MTTEARAAARSLPDGQGPGGLRSRGDRAYAVFGTTLLFALPVALAVFMLTLPWGWVTAPAGIALWFGCNLLWRRIAPDQVAVSVAVDVDGAVHVVSGATMVGAHRRMFASGVRRWFARGAVLGTLLVVIGVAIAVVLGVTVFDPSISFIPFLVELLAALIAMASLVYHGAVVPMRARSKGHRILDPSVVMPMLGLFAKRHGDAAAVGGVPADRLLAVVGDASPEESAEMARQSAAMGFLARAGGAAS